MDTWFEIRCWHCSAWVRVDDHDIEANWYLPREIGCQASLWLPNMDAIPQPCPTCGIPSQIGMPFDVRVAGALSGAVEAARGAVPAAVAECLRDPAVIARAIMSLPPEMRDHVRVLFDALEASGYDPTNDPAPCGTLTE